MAEQLSRVGYVNNAYQASETVSNNASTESQGDTFQIPANTGQVTFNIRRKTGDAGFKVQVTTSTDVEIKNGTAEWFDWTVYDADADGFYRGGTDYQYWIPIPSGIRLVVEPTATASSVYFSVRAN